MNARLPAGVVPTAYDLALDVDPAATAFSGVVTIRVTLASAQSDVWIHGVGFDVKGATVTPAGGTPLDAAWEPASKESGLVALRTSTPIPAGGAEIRIPFKAAFNAELQGLFRVTSAGTTYAYTKFEPFSARYAFPCFDEPGLKTPFTLTLTVPRALKALGNTRVASEENLDGDGGVPRRRVHFATTEKLPTYLVAWAVGDFDTVDLVLPKTELRDHPLTVRGVAPKSRGDELAFGLKNARAIVESLERYFGTAYPYDKLDLIGAPDYPAGAMENAGAIIFRDAALLVNEKTASEAQRRRVLSTTIHEIAHQWFGDLVTMQWWDDLWLNEAFASWMAARTMVELYPTFGTTVQDLAETRNAMSGDALVSARQIRQPIASPHDIRNAFDAITYQKGEAVLGMFEGFVGPDAFRQGVQRYIADHRHGNATTDGLLAALSQAAHRDVAAPFRTFLMQSAVPLVDVRLECEAGKSPRVHLHQSRYLPLGSRAKDDRTWQIPVCLRYGTVKAGTAAGSVSSCTLVTETEGTFTLPTTSCPAWIHPNDNGAGYYRATMPEAETARLMKGGYAHLSPRERLAFADDIIAAFDAGKIHAAEALPALKPMATDRTPDVAIAPLAILTPRRDGLLNPLVRDTLADATSRPQVEAYVRELYAANARRIGWSAPRGGEATGDSPRLRRELIAADALVGRDPTLRAAGMKRGLAYLGVGTDGKIHADAVSSDLVGVVLTIAAEDGGAPVLEALTTHLHTVTDGALRGELLRALGAVREPELAKRARVVMMSDDVRGSELLPAFMAQMNGRETRDESWKWLRENFDAFAKKLPAQLRQYIPRFPHAYCDKAHRDEVAAFLEPRVAELPGAPRYLAGTLEEIDLCVALADAQRESTRAFFSRSSASANPTSR